MVSRRNQLLNLSNINYFIFAADEKSCSSVLLKTPLTPPTQLSEVQYVSFTDTYQEKECHFYYHNWSPTSLLLHME